MVVSLTAGLAESWMVWTQWKWARSSHERSAKLVAELSVLHRAMPPLNSATTAELTAELSDALKVLGDLRAELTAADADPGLENPGSELERADGYFAIASFVESMREEAEAGGIRIKPDERFGFADYTHSGPELRDLPRVLRERHAMELLLKAVFAARPHQLLSVQRERRSSPADVATGAGVSARTNVRADYFDWDPRDSIRHAGSIDTVALRISFVGQTVSLRSLLNQLARFEVPLVVRVVDVGLAVKAAERPGEASDSELPKPLVSRSLSRFTVTVEFMEWIDAVPTQS